MDERGKAAWGLAILSMSLAELVTASTLPLGFYNPVFLLLFLGMYGGGVLLVREFLVRFDKGPASLVALALAYAVLEEALILRSWFDPEYPNVQGLGWFGRMAGVNTLWALWVTPLLALIAMVIPIFLTSLLFPQTAGKPLLSRRQLSLPVLGLAAVFGVTRILPPNYATGLVEYGFAFAAAATLVALAVFLPKEALQPRARRIPLRRWPFLAFGGLWCALDFFLYPLGPAIGWHPLVSAGLMIAVPLLGLVLLHRVLPARAWREYLYLFFVGVLSFFAIMDIVRGLAGGPVGLVLVGAGFLAAAAILYRELWPAAAQQDGARPTPLSAPGAPPPSTP